MEQVSARWNKIHAYLLHIDADAATTSAAQGTYLDIMATIFQWRIESGTESMCPSQTSSSVPRVKNVERFVSFCVCTLLVSYLAVHF